MRHGVTRKRSTQRLKHRGNLFRKKLQIKGVSFNSRLKAFWIIGQRKAFYGQKISGSSCARKENVDIDILIKSMVTEKPYDLSE